MVAVAFHHIVHVAQCKARIGGIVEGRFARITSPALEKHLPHQQSVLVVSFHNGLWGRRHVFVGNHVYASISQQSSLVVHALGVHVEQHVGLNKAATAENALAVYPENAAMFAVAFL